MDPSLMEHLGLRYLKVANVLRTKILEGVYQPGERLPRQHDLTKEHNVAFTTLKQALDILEREGYVDRKVGNGTYAALPKKHTPRALVVDDDENIRALFATVLESQGWKSNEVESGAAALERLKEQRFDLLFLDLVMPGINGADTFSKVLELDPDARVVIITAYPDSALVAKALDVGPFEMMKKPLRLDALRNILDWAATTLEAVARM